MLRVLHAELLKLKRTLAFRMVFVMPLLVALLQFFALWRSRKFGADFKLWETLPTNMLGIWAVFMMPLLITLETALLNGIEHGDRQWKHILALPIPRHTVYLAKFVVAQALNAASTLFLCVLTVLAGLAIMQLRPELAGSGPVPYGRLARHAALVWLAAWLIVAIHTWVSVRWQTERRVCNAAVTVSGRGRAGSWARTASKPFQKTRISSMTIPFASGW